MASVVRVHVEPLTRLTAIFNLSRFKLEANPLVVAALSADAVI